MMEFKDIIKMSRSLLSKGGGGKMTTRTFSAERDWFILLGIAFTVFFIGVAIGVFHLYTYLSISPEEVKEEDVTLPFFSSLSVQAITEEYAERKEKFEQLLSEDVSGSELPVEDSSDVEEEEGVTSDGDTSPSLSF